MSVRGGGGGVEERADLGVAGDLAGEALEPGEGAAGVDDDGERLRGSADEDAGNVVADTEGRALGEGEGDGLGRGEAAGEVGGAARVVEEEGGEGGGGV